MLGNPSLSIDYYDKVLKVERRNKQALEERELSKMVLEALNTACLAMEKKLYKKVCTACEYVCVYVCRCGCGWGHDLWLGLKWKSRKSNMCVGFLSIT